MSGNWWADLVFGARGLRRRPWFALLAVATFGLGIGANTALFSVVNAVLLQTFGYADAGKLVQISGVNRKGQSTGVSMADMQAFAQRGHAFEEIGTSRIQSFTVSGPREPENVLGHLVSADCFRALAPAPLVGRVFTASDFQSGAPPVAVLSYGMWQTTFEGDPQIAGRRVLMNGREHTVIGVMRPEFYYPHPAFRMWTPLIFTAEDLANHSLHTYTLIARLKPGVSREAATAELQAISQALERESPSTNTGWRAVLEPVNERILGSMRPVLWTLTGAVGFVLLMACLNVSNLLMARGMERSREMAVRAALGAGRLRLVRQSLTESLLIALAGGGLGLLLARAGLRGLLAMLPARSVPILPGAEHASLDGRVLGAAMLATLATGVLFGLLPAIQISRPNVEESLKEGGRANSGGLRRRRWLGVLIMAETALSVILLAGAGLMIRSLAKLVDVHLGFRPEHVLTMQIPSEWEDYAVRNNASQTERKMQYLHEIVRHVAAVPGVGTAGLVTTLPLGPIQIQTRIFVEGRPVPGPGEDIRVQYRAINADYFQAMGIPLLRGRTFTDEDRVNRPLVGIVSETMARRFWPGEDAVGKRITLNNATTGPWMTIVGVAGSVRHDSLASEPEAELYTSYVQTLLASQIATVVVRTPMDPGTLAGAVRAAIREVDRNQPIADVKTMSEVVSDSVARPRLYTVLLAVFAGLALVLAAAGIYSVIAWTVSQRTHEIGIRMALGAGPGAVLRAMLGRAMAAALAGSVVGLGGAAALTSVLKSQLHGVTATDPLTFAVVPVVLGAVAWMAAYVPARRATHIDPVIALRNE